MCVVAAAGAGLGMSAGTSALLSLGTTAIGYILQASGQQASGEAQQNMYNYQAAVNRNNAIMANWQAEDAIKRGREEEDQHRLKVQQIKGTQRAAFADRGVDLGSENVSDTLADTAFLGELDALAIRSNAEREAYGYRQQASNYEASANMDELAGRNAVNAANTEATTTILGGASLVADRWSNYKAKGIF